MKLLWTIAFLLLVISCRKQESKTTRMAELPVLGRPGPEGQSHTIRSFELIDTNGRVISSDNFDQMVYLTEFFFTSCPSVCPKVAVQMEQIHDQLKNEQGFAMLSITLDPEYDTPRHLREFASSKGVAHSNWYFLTGDKEEIFDLARTSFYTPIVELAGTEKDIIHHGILALVDCNGQIRGMYDGKDPEIVKRVEGDVRFLLKQCGSQSMLTSQETS